MIVVLAAACAPWGRVGVGPPTTEGARTLSLPPEPTPVTVDLDEWTVTAAARVLPSGPVAFDVSNEGRRTHAFRVRGEDGATWRSGALAAGDALTFTVTLQPGSYRLDCPLPHRADPAEVAAMATTVEVLAADERGAP